MNWDTDEVRRWIANDEGLYHAASRCTTEHELRTAFEDAYPRDELGTCTVDLDEVDWESLLADDD